MKNRCKSLLILSSILLLASNPSSANGSISGAYSISSNISLLSALSIAMDSQSGVVYQIDEAAINQIRKDLKNLSQSQSNDSARKVALERSGGEQKAIAEQSGLGAWQIGPEVQEADMFNPTRLGMLQPPGIIDEGALVGSQQSSGGVTVIWNP